MTEQPGPVTADDLAALVAASDAALRGAADADLSVLAHGLEWTCWETLEHLADDYFFYAAQLGSPTRTEYLAFDGHVRRAGGPDNALSVDPTEGLPRLLDALTACGALLVAMVRTAPADAIGHHGYGGADAEASAAMGILEGAAHTWDIATALGLHWQVEPDLCARVLHRLMPDVERTPDGWSDFLWATGRLDEPGRPRRTAWGWDNSPRQVDA